MTAQDFLDRLEGVRPRGSGKWSAQCPAHQDRGPSLSIGEGIGRILVHCFAGCPPGAIVATLGLAMRDLFTATSTSRRQRPTQKSQRLDLVAAAFRFELASLDRRLRADAVLEAVADFSGDDLGDQDRDRLMTMVARAYADNDRAEFLETVADDFRMKAFHEREDRHAA